MVDEHTPGHESPDDELEAHSQAPQPSLAAEFWDFLCHNKKWWLAPILIVLLILGALVVLGGTGLPWIYAGI